MAKINYSSIFKKAFILAWKNKQLWWLGFFIAITNVGGSFNFSSNEEEMSQIETAKVIDFFQQNLNWIVWVIIGIFILWIILMVLGFISRAGLIYAINESSENKKVTFKESFKNGKKYFWRLFFISLTLGLGALALFAATYTPVALLFMNHKIIAGGFLAVLAFVIVIPLLILFIFMGIFGQIYAVLGDLKIWSALESAYNLFRKNIWSSIITGLLFIPANILFFLGILLIFIPILIIFSIIGFIMYLILGKLAIVVVAILGALLILVIGLILKSAYEVFAQSVWVFFFQEVAAPKVEEKVTETKKEVVDVPKAMPVIEYKKEQKVD